MTAGDDPLDEHALLDDPVPPAIRDLERVLGIALVIQDIDPGPPVRITALGLYDAQTTPLLVEAATEREAWVELGRAIAVWRNVDPRNVRFWAGGA